MWNDTEKNVLFCKDCINKHFEAITSRYKSKETALKIVFALLDWLFYTALYKSISEANSIFNPGLYARQLQMRQHQYKVFANSIVEGELGKQEETVRKERESKWNKKDRQNMNYAISVVGYDPFDGSGLTDADRRYCFNILACYCDSEGIREDGHKRQAAVQITQLHLQCRKIDDMINEELLQNVVNEKRLKDLSETKNKFLSSISSLAKDNNLASNYNDNSRAGRNTLSTKMKEIAEVGYEPIRTNLFDIRTCEAMRQIADISNKSILEQITFDNSDYSEMLKEQREMLRGIQARLDEAEEENRMLKNKIADIEAAKKRKQV